MRYSEGMLGLLSCCSSLCFASLLPLLLCYDVDACRDADESENMASRLRCEGVPL